jgi:hypothetical protein
MPKDQQTVDQESIQLKNLMGEETKGLGDITMSEIWKLLEAETSVHGSTVFKCWSIRVYQETASGLKEFYCVYNEIVT